MTTASGEWTGRILRGVLFGLGAVLALVCIVILLFLVPAVRGRLLSEALNRADARLPGTVIVQHARWPSPGTVTIEGLTWVDAGDTLLALQRLHAAVDLVALARRDLRSPEVTLHVLKADIAAIRDRLPAPSGEPARGPTPERGRGFPRVGSLPGIPSVAVDTLRLAVGWLRLSESSILEHIEVTGTLDLLSGRTPRAEIRAFTVRDPVRGWAVDRFALDADLAEGRMSATGAGSLSSDLPVFLRLSSGARDAFRLIITESPSGLPPAVAGLDLGGAFIRTDGRVVGLRCEGLLRTPGTDGLRRLPGMDDRLKSVPSLEGLPLTLAGSLEWKPSARAEGALQLTPNAWCDGGALQLSYQDGRFTADSLSLRLPDLALRGRARMDRETIDARANLEIRGTRWLATLRPGTQRPDSLAADLDLAVQGSREAPGIVVALAAGVRLGGVRLEDVLLQADVPVRREEPGTFRFEARSADLVLRGEGRIDRRDGVGLELRPFTLEDTRSRARPHRARPEAVGFIRVGPEGAIQVRNVRLVGALGDARMDARFARERGGDFELSLAWPEPPAILQRSPRFSGPGADSLGVRWPTRDPFRFALRGTLRPSGVGQRLDASGTFVLPGPRTFSFLLPPAASVDDLGPLSGALDLSTRPSEQGPEVDARLMLEPTPWLEVGRLQVSVRDGRVAIDTAAVLLEGLRFEGSGTLRDSLWDVAADVTVSDARLLQRAGVATDDSMDLELRMHASFEGTPSDPDLEASLVARAVGSRIALGRLDGEVRWAQDGRLVALDAPLGLRAGRLQLNRLSARYTGEAGSPDPFAGHLILEAIGPEVSLYQQIRVANPEGRAWEVYADTVAVSLLGHDLRSVRPFRLRAISDERRLEVEGLDLAGGLGRVQADGVAGPDSTDMTVAVLLRLPEKAPLAALPPEVWPEELECRLRASGKNHVQAEGRVLGLTLGTESDLAVRFDADAGAEGIRANLSVAEGNRTVLDAKARIPASLTFYPPGGHFAEGPVFADVVLTGLPVPVRTDGKQLTQGPARTTRVQGRAALRGTAGEPSLYASARVSFPGWPKISRYALEMETLVVGRSGPDAQLLALPEKGSLLSPDPPVGPAGPGLAAVFSLNRDAHPLLRGSATYPLIWSIVPPSVVPREGGTLRVEVTSEDLPLAEFDPLTPPNVGLGGNARVQFAASGPLEDPELGGRLVMWDLKVSMADGTRVLADVDLTLGGTKRRPSATGEIVIGSGVLRIPEPPKNLHPLDGGARLWRSRTAPAGEEGEAGPSTTAPPEGARPPGTEMDLDVRVSIHSGLWIRGQGLDVELAGDLRLVQRGAFPTVSGELQALRGSLLLLDRNFTVERGQVVFYGEDETDPSLDLVLSCRVENTIVRVLLRGTARKPELLLTSDPEMTEGDIMSVLLFGEPLDHLNSDQVDLVQRRSMDVAAALGAAQLETRLARQLGVDMLTIGRGGREGGRRSLVLGKYISRRVLLKYEQALEEWGSFFINLEYFLTQRVRLETLIGSQSQSGLEVNWTTDY